MKDKQLRKDFEEFKKLLMLDAEIPTLTEGVITSLQRVVQAFKTLHPCSTCKALFREEDLQRVEEKYRKPEMTSIWHIEWDGLTDQTLFFCPAHKVPYDRIQDGKYYKDNVQVDLKGKEIK